MTHLDYLEIYGTVRAVSFYTQLSDIKHLMIYTIQFEYFSCRKDIFIFTLSHPENDGFLWSELGIPWVSMLGLWYHLRAFSQGFWADFRLLCSLLFLHGCTHRRCWLVGYKKNKDMKGKATFIHFIHQGKATLQSKIIQKTLTAMT